MLARLVSHKVLLSMFIMIACVGTFHLPSPCSLVGCRGLMVCLPLMALKSSDSTISGSQILYGFGVGMW